GTPKQITRYWADASRKHLFDLTNTSGIVLRNISINDTACTGCDAPVWGYNASNLTIAKTSVTGSRTHGLALYSGSNVRVIKSSINNSAQFGIWANNLISGLKIQSSTFQGNDSNAILSYADNLLITKSTFTGNHDTAVFGHSGGQLFIGAGT